MRILVDTNVLIWHAAEAGPVQHLVHGQLADSLSAFVELCISPQNVYEFWVVATRPLANNGLGLAPQAARELVDTLREAYTMLPETEDMVDRWLELCVRYRVSGRTAHDARLVAWMHTHRITQLVTLNAADFKRFPDIECIVPGKGIV